MLDFFKQFGGDQLLSQITEKTGLSSDQASSVMGSALPQIMNLVKEKGLSADLLSVGNLSAIAGAVSEKTGLSADTITNALGAAVPFITDFLSNKGGGENGGIMDMVSGLLDKNKDGNLLDDVMGFFK